MSEERHLLDLELTADVLLKTLQRSFQELSTGRLRLFLAGGNCHTKK